MVKQVNLGWTAGLEKINYSFRFGRMMKAMSTFRMQQVSQGQPTEAPAKTIQKRTTAQPERGVMAGAKILIFHTGVYLLEMVSSKFISVEIREVTAARFDGFLDFAL